MFGSTKCGKCGGASFKLQQIDVQGAAFKLNSVQCTACGVPIGLTEYYDNGALLKKQEKKLAELETRLKDVQAYVHNIASAMRR